MQLIGIDVKVEIYQYTDSTTVKHEKIRDAPIHPGCLWSPMTFLGQIPNLSSFTVHFPFSGGEFSSKIPTLRVRITSKKKAGWFWRKKHLWHLIFGQTRKSPHRNGFMTSETLVLSGGSTLGKKKELLILWRKGFQQHISSQQSHHQRISKYLPSIKTHSSPLKIGFPYP